MQGAQFLSAGQLLLTTLVVKLAVVAALATMLVRYRRFRHILIFERRDWPDRLPFPPPPRPPPPGGGGRRGLCPKEAIWHFSPFVFTSLHRRAWQMLRSLQVDWQVVLLLAPVGL